MHREAVPLRCIGLCGTRQPRSQARNPEGGRGTQPPEPATKGKRARAPPRGGTAETRSRGGAPPPARSGAGARGPTAPRSGSLAPRRSDEPASGGARRSRRDGRRVASEARPQRNACHRVKQAVDEAVRRSRIARPRCGLARRERAAHTEEVPDACEGTRHRQSRPDSIVLIVSIILVWRAGAAVPPIPAIYIQRSAA